MFPPKGPLKNTGLPQEGNEDAEHLFDRCHYGMYEVMA